MKRFYKKDVVFYELMWLLKDTSSVVALLLDNGERSTTGRITNFRFGFDPYNYVELDNERVFSYCSIIGVDVYASDNWKILLEKFDGNAITTIPICENMSPERFKELLEELDGNSVKTLAEKNARYSSDGDALHNFRSGAEIAGGTPAQACWGYLTKHLVALRDMVEKDDFSNREDFLEKCQDTINYIRFLWCIGNENNETKNTKKESN